MKRFGKIFEENDSTAQARALGLAYAGGGYWQDPKTGQIAYETVKGQLQPYQGSGPDNPMAQMGAGGGGAQPEGAVPQQTAMQRLMARGMQPGQGIGAAAEPGQAQGDGEVTDAQAPSGFNQGQGWDPGPNGDTCVGGEEPKPEGIPVDSFVRRGSNEADWTSGPDGSNFFNTNFAEWMNAAPGEFLPEGLNSPGTETRKLRAIGQAMRDGSDWQTTAPRTSQMGTTTKRNFKGTYYGDPSRPKGRTIGSNMKPAVQEKDQAKVDLLNQDAQQFLKDPSFDMKMGKTLGEGAFGKVGYSKSDPNVVIKEGEIGPNEMKALWAMRDNPAFPTLINARFDTPFLHKSSGYNNPGDESILRGHGGQYFDPDDQESWEFDKRYPTAKGTYAMTKMQGQTLYDAMYEADDKGKQNILRNLIRRRRDMHLQGISHNDMHGDNVFVDEQGNTNVLDLGLAKADPLSALMEGLGGVSGEDYQLASKAQFENLPEDLRERFQENLVGVRDQMLDGLNPDTTDPEDIEDFMKGGIRMKDTDFSGLRERFPNLQDNDNVMSMIKMLYENTGNTEVENRMSRAFDKRKADSDYIEFANEIRAKRGEPRIKITNPDIVPRKNLDFDD